MRAGKLKKKAHISVEAQPPAPARISLIRRPLVRGHALRILALWVFVLLAYSNSFQSALVFDNDPIIRGDIRIRELTIRNLSLILGQNYWFPISYSHAYRPLTTLSYLFNYAVLGNGTNPAPYHWVNFALHAINIALVYLLALRLLGGTTAAFVAAALWALHPVLTESVTNIVGRADLLAGLGILAAILCHMRASKTEGRRKLPWLVALVIAAAVAVFSKENGVMVLAGMALFDITRGAGRPWRAHIPGYALACVPVALFLIVRARVLGGTAPMLIPFTENPLAGANFWTARMTAIKVIGKYLALLVWPQHLSCDYSYNQVPLSGWGDWKAFVSLALCIIALAVAVLCWRRARAACFFIAFFFVMLAPTANLLFPIGTIMAERFLYLPAVGFAGCAVLAWRAAGRLWPAMQSWGSILAVVLCSALAVRTWARNADWTDNVSLWTSAVSAAPNSYKTHENFAALPVSEQQNREAALREAEHSIAILDSLPDERNISEAYSTAARCYRLEGDASGREKTVWYYKALAALQRARRIDQAWSKQKGHESGAEEVYLELGRIYDRLSKPQEKLAALQYGRRVALGDNVCEELATTYEAAGDLERAIISHMEALSLNPDRTAIAAKLAALYGRFDPGGCSLVNGAVNLECPLVRGHLCTAARNVVGLYLGKGERIKAGTVRSQAISNFGCPAELFHSAPPD